MKLRLSHVGIVVKDVNAAAGQFAALGYRVRGPAEHDPVQTAHVLFLELPGDSTGLELVAPDGPKSKLANALAKGGGLNHLCYETDDIEAACRDFYAKGLFLLHKPVPAVAFEGRRIAWLMGRNGIPVELVERPGGQGAPGEEVPPANS